MAHIKPRLERYKMFIDTQFLDGMQRNKEYSLEYLSEDLKTKIQQGQFNTIVFTGMGCSAIVSDLIKGFFMSMGISIDVHVLNDYDLQYLINIELLKNERTLVIVSSYSGYSQEPMNAYEAIKVFTRNIIFLTSGGKLAQIAERDDISVIFWKLENPDREYPLFHVPQYFSILLDIFHRLGLLSENYYDQVIDTVRQLQVNFNEDKRIEAKEISEKLRDSEIVLLATAKWYQSLLKIVKMHFNEIAMVPAHQNFFHEFCHSEVAVFTNPNRRLSILLFRDMNDDEYTQKKMDHTVSLLSQPNPENDNISVVIVEISSDNFISQIFSTLLFVHYIVYFLGSSYNTESRDLISSTAGNPWYSSKTIQEELEQS